MTDSSNKKTKLLFVTTSFPQYEGDIAGSFFLPLLKNLSDQYDIEVLIPDNNCFQGYIDYVTVTKYKYFFKKNWQKLTGAQGIPENIKQQPIICFQFPFLIISLSCNIYKLAKRSDLIISNWLLPSGICGALVAKLLKKPHLIIEHSAGAHYIKKLPFCSALMRFIIKHSNKLILVSPFIEKTLNDFITEKEKVEIIPMGIEIDQFESEFNYEMIKKEYGVPPNNTIVLFMGRLVEIKGLDVLIHALSNILNVTLVIAGDGEKIEYYKQLARKLNVDTIFTGFVSGYEKIKLLKVADIFVIPSLEVEHGRTEGSPVVLMEAMAAEKIIIASDAGGISNMIEHNVNGLLVEPGKVEELKKSISMVVANKDFYYKLAKEAKISSLTFDIKMITQKYFDIIENVINDE